MTLSCYLFSFAAAQLICGPLLDHFGRRRLLPASLWGTALASIVCAFAPNISCLIIGRLLQGITLSCAHLVASSGARDYDDEIERAKVISYISMIVAISPIFAPVLGSLIFSYLGWQANFIAMA